MPTSFQYGFARIKDFEIEPIVSTKGKVSAGLITLAGEPNLKTSRRFWTSLQCRFGFSSNIFRYFTHREVFDRISEKAPDDRVRYCVERNDKGATLLAVTNPKAALVKHDDMIELLGKYQTKETVYTDGIIRSTHAPKVGAQPFQVSGDDFANQFVIDTPIDGFGKPNIYLSLLRMICTNGAVGYGKAFRSEINIGKTDEDVRYALIRAMDGFNNEEGFQAMRSRFENAGKSWASVNECQKLYRALATLANRNELKTIGREAVKMADGSMEVLETANPIFHNFHKMTGDLTQIYGLANLETLTTKRQRTLPASCKVYDLLNYATEVATHCAAPRGARALQAYVGDLVSNEYDLEGTVDQFSDWRDFFVGSEATAETMQKMSSR